MDQIKQKFYELQMVFERLSPREKVLVMVMVGAVLSFAAMMVGFGVNMSLTKLEDRLETKRDSYVRIASLETRYQQAKETLKKTKSEIDGNRGNLTQNIGTIAADNGVEIYQVTSTKGAVDKKAKIREESVKVELQRVELEPLLRFLETIEERNKLFFIRSVNMRRRYDNKAQIDVSFLVSTLVPLDED